MMSRHTFAGTAGITVTIGYDRPLATFFVQVFKPHATMDGEEETIVWEGTSPGELPTAAAAIAIARDYADLPADLGITLESDRLKTLGRGDGPAQIDFKRFGFGSEK